VVLRDDFSVCDIGYRNHLVDLSDLGAVTSALLAE
jgi:hypothetical protein